jgi:endoglucanase
MRTRPAWVAAVLIAAAALVTPAVGATPAHADTVICDQFGSTTIGNKYIVMNNRWGTSAQQCINVTGTGFQITSQQGTAPTNGAPVSYPAIYIGCHYGACSPGTNLPRQVSQIGSVPNSISYNYVAGTYDAAYDIWLDPTPKTTGVNQMEIMIWFNRQGPISPIGSPVGTTTIGGRSWQVWQGNNGGNDVVSYVAPSPVASWSFDVLNFVNDVDARTQVTSSWYLTSVQAGFEPWSGGAGLAVNSFTADVVAGSNGGGGGGGTGQLIVGQGSGRCVDIAGNPGTDGTPVQLWDCWSGAANQKWARTGSTLVNPQTGKCLDVAGGSTANGAQVRLWSCNGTGAQNWQVNANGTITNPQSGKCLDAVGQGTANGTGLQIYDCYGGGGTQANQVWALR